MHKYIDDTTLSHVITNRESHTVNTALDEIQMWTAENHMRININKTKAMDIHFRKMPLDLYAPRIEDKMIDIVQIYKILGV